MGEGEHYVIAVGANSPLKSYDDLKALSAQRPVKFSVTGPEGTAYAATVIGTKLLGLRSQLITGYKSSADYVVAAIRGDSDAVIASYPTAMRFARGNPIRMLASFRKEAMPPGSAGCDRAGPARSRSDPRRARGRRAAGTAGGHPGDTLECACQGCDRSQGGGLGQGKRHRHAAQDGARKPRRWSDSSACSSTSGSRSW